MTINAANWLRQNRAVYFDNATSVRDYRVQLRGNRSVILFGTYLVVLIGVAMTVYSSTASAGAVEVVEAQRKLKDFYTVIMELLAGLVSLVAPALTATTVVMERQRRSLDLVFSAPVTPKYFLVGKMMSSFRYTWMLLILALPVTATCVVLGGASWSDVLISYTMLSLQGLIMTAIGLLISTICQRPVSAVIWSYGASIAYLFLTFTLSEISMTRTTFGSHGTNEAPFFAGLNPFLIEYTANTYTAIGMVHVPNWILVAAAAGLICKLCLLGAGTQLSPQPERAIKSLRIHGLIYLGFIVYYVTLANSAGSVSGAASSMLGRDLFGILSPLFILMPFLSTYGVDGERRLWPNGVFSIRHILDGTPSGGLPYILALALTAAGGLALGYVQGSGASLPHDYPIWFLYTAGFWIAFWSIGRFASATFAGVRAARTLQFASFLLLVILPIPFLSAIAGTSLSSPEDSSWNLYPLRALFLDSAEGTALAFGWGAVMLVFGICVGALAEARTARKMKLLGDRYAFQGSR